MNRIDAGVTAGQTTSAIRAAVLASVDDGIPVLVEGPLGSGVSWTLEDISTQLRRAKLVTDNIPGAQLFIDRLIVSAADLKCDQHIWTWTPPAGTFAPDPFFVVRVGDATAYIGVWEEPEFEVLPS